MTLAALIAGLFAFVAVLRGLKVQRHALDAIGVAQEAVGVIADPDLTDEVKERHVQRAALSLLRSFVILLAIGAAACVSAAAFVIGGDLFGLFSIERAMGIATSWPFILWSTVGAVGLWLVLARVGGQGQAAEAASTADEMPYSALDKALHNFAFASPERQLALSSIEDKVWRRTIEAVQAERPVFVTSLPRAGTTILLELLAGQGEFASATYRNMPFTMAPLLWGQFSRVFRKTGAKAERAHGDGIAVDFDSPEAFEEMIWMAFWPGHYGKARIGLWTAADRKPDFEAFLARHMRKIVAGKSGAFRYVSKDNANIARLPLLAAAFPDAQVVIPIRNPAAQVASLMRQHRRFCELHARDRFARQYMEGIGHFEFGAALRPIAFPGAPEDAGGAEHADYWLRYWIAAYNHVLATAPGGAVFVDHDALSARPTDHLPLLAEALGVGDRTAFLAASETFRAPKPSPELPGASPLLMRRATALHRALLARALRMTTRERKVV
ncbi:sulfotransferase [Chelativorans sp. M5D2P16]|uniref:sulfotransferase n=1 Tax=Chelativorans sp. M5D2P16 TaxID=3095678 RepID=UPI002ACA2FE9|nr:sulfotransferase [Chelativorans sp. M5D2P16]MDZ5696215.1 sulfotransferase [Chelativorans sp. M5D2P16]